MPRFLIILLSTIFFLSVSSVQASNYILPVSGNFRVTQPPGGSYSHSTFAKLPCAACVEAWDIAGSGVPVSVAEGEVIKVDFMAEGYGNYVKIRHPDGLVSLYAHLAYSSVSPGQTIFQGQQIGVIDSTGGRDHSTGSHLHFSLFKNGRPYSANDLIDFSGLKGNPIVRTFDTIFPKVGGGAPEPLKPIDLKPIAEMVTKFYAWALGVGGVLALGIMIYGGVLYTASAGNESNIKEAKEWLKAAIFGLILLLSVYLILYTVNPCIVSPGSSGCT